MSSNMGLLDRRVRMVIGLLLLGLLLIDGNARWFGLIGLVPLATGLIGSCPLYSLFGINSHAKPHPKM